MWSGVPRNPVGNGLGYSLDIGPETTTFPATTFTLGESATRDGSRWVAPGPAEPDSAADPRPSLPVPFPSAGDVAPEPAEPAPAADDACGFACGISGFSLGFFLGEPMNTGLLFGGKYKTLELS